MSRTENRPARSMIRAELSRLRSRGDAWAVVLGNVVPLSICPLETELAFRQPGGAEIAPGSEARPWWAGPWASAATVPRRPWCPSGAGHRGRRRGEAAGEIHDSRAPASSRTWRASRSTIGAVRVVHGRLPPDVNRRRKRELLAARDSSRRDNVPRVGVVLSHHSPAFYGPAALAGRRAKALAPRRGCTRCGAAYKSADAFLGKLRRRRARARRVFVLLGREKGIVPRAPGRTWGPVEASPLRRQRFPARSRP